MVINGTNFNDEWAKSVDEQTFINTFPISLWSNVPDREQKLIEAWRLINGVKEVKKKRPLEVLEEQTDIV